MQITWLVLERLEIFCPNFSAMAPPSPISGSSKIIVFDFKESDNSKAIDNKILDISPPDATLLSEPGGISSEDENKNSMSSVPFEFNSQSLKETSQLHLFIHRSFRCSNIFFENLLELFFRI